MLFRSRKVASKLVGIDPTLAKQKRLALEVDKLKIQNDVAFIEKG